MQDSQWLDFIINASYLVAAILFIYGIKGLTHPRTAVRGNMFAALGMLIAAVVTLFEKEVVTFPYIIAGVVIGSLIGIMLAQKIAMTAMPQLVALFNGFGGGASVLVAGAAMIQTQQLPGDLPETWLQIVVSTVLSGIIGSVTLTGSLIAFGKLQGLISDKIGQMKGVGLINFILGAGAVVFGVLQITQGQDSSLNYWILVAFSLVLGVFLVVKIGGADMPVAVALLNSYSGLAAAMTGFVLSNNALIIAGSLVGASGLILTNIMCKAMNRSLMHVLTGGLSEAGEEGPSADEVYEGKIKQTSGEELAMMLDGAQRFVIVPGYGMAVAQAQHAVRDLMNLLEAQGTEVEFAIHPVAGRMPGHMNVLLAEADVPYDKLKEMDEINPTFAQTDVVLVIGANDVINPLAKTDPNSPIAGMPILDVDEAHTVVIVKRSLSPGYAGIPNPLFAADNCLMFFSDGKKAVLDIIAAIKESQ